MLVAARGDAHNDMSYPYANADKATADSIAVQQSPHFTWRVQLECGDTYMPVVTHAE